MNQERLMQIILGSHISEKSTSCNEQNQYVFEVCRDAKKSEIKDAIELLFNSKVKSVQIVNVRPKAKVFKSRSGSRKAWKKAYVVLQGDKKLDIISAQTV